MIGYERGDDGVVVLTLDDPDATVTTMHERFDRALRAAVDRLEAERADVTGVIVTSAKTTFCAGADLDLMLTATRADAARIFARVEGVKADLRRLERLGVPVVAALNGTALGGGLEIALACHRRLVADVPMRLGLPEVSLGLLPGFGGLTRTVRMLGLQRALTSVLLPGTRFDPAGALAAGLVDEIVPAGRLLAAARQWIAAHPDAGSQPWDRPGYRLPGGAPSSPELAAVLQVLPARLRTKAKGVPELSARNILSAAVEGAHVDAGTASRIETRYLVELITSRLSTNLVTFSFVDRRRVDSGAARPAGPPSPPVRKVGVLGAGMMGAGIAHVCARAGLDVVLKDVSLDGAVAGRSRAAASDEVLARIHPTAEAADLAGCDLVIEAVFEDQRLKQAVFGEIEDVVAPDALLCSNTSSLPIGGLAAGVRRPADFVGMHFFSPVERMPLVEVIVGKQTSDAAVARAYDMARRLGKTPIVVNDSRGFFTSRVFAALVVEAAAMVGEGVDPVTIERAATLAGFPAPPLAMTDEVSLGLLRRIRDEARAAGEGPGLGFAVSPGMAVVDRMVTEFGRPGRASGAGFYDYPGDGPKRLWRGLWSHYARPDRPVPVRDLQERFTFIMALETATCLAEGVLRSVAEANVGSVLGIGFPARHGGALQYVAAYDGGPAGFAARARELAAAYGERFEPPPELAELVRR
ncbi:3-hydroxyacyl-CoA dehydrogenase NAD-binding domain-containing protein [Jiangella anatolica]|uniref:3-hydroxyacyl-CoA dehydrogenase n=1 Tax=Jiangella anatolica TaxID=2670374 RepID=A0A2W2BDG5_9ACTN|nr:3-hydroxyacyl-CoA dehydrogenase NAD-binding domain-containing protein [Jiangella anatolica]PZF83360.1 3-hydroxyacyl-CoA dehydrogenase [Jiangella anatolica]